MKGGGQFLTVVSGGTDAMRYKGYHQGCVFKKRGKGGEGVGTRPRQGGGEGKGREGKGLGNGLHMMAVCVSLRL